MTISELRLALDISFDSKANVVERHATHMSNGSYLFVDSSDGSCHLFDRNGNEDDISKLTHIEAKLFYEDSKLKSIVIPDNVRSIDKFAFGNCGRLTHAAICEGVTSIEWSTFGGCSSLVNVMIPDSVTSIGGYAFHHCSSLTGVTIGNNVTNIKAGAFYDCSGLTNVTIPDNVMSIEYSTFENCYGLISVTIGNRITSIGNWAFSNCTNLKELIFKGKSIDKVKSMDNYPFGIEDESVIKCEA